MISTGSCGRWALQNELVDTVPLLIKGQGELDARVRDRLLSAQAHLA
ncbi:MAG: hypothetical protein KJ072_01265 [Verrucomicrobia bacterium]|nr:hypothetical protein [Verrucomicrobiota bacterium]